MNKKDFKKENKYYSTKSSQHKGFTLIETLVAIFILVIAVTGPISAAQNSLKAAFLARDQVTAFYLAQDAIEYLINIRDTNALGSPSVPFEDTSVFGLAVSGNNSKKFNIDSANNTVELCSNNVINNSQTFDEIECPKMEFDNDGYFVIDGNGTESKYSRGIAIKQSDTNDDEFEIVVEVVWNTSLFLTDRRIVVKQNIYNWLVSS